MLAANAVRLQRLEIKAHCRPTTETKTKCTDLNVNVVEAVERAAMDRVTVEPCTEATVAPPGIPALPSKSVTY